MKCPYCNCEMEKDDQRATTDRGIIGDLVYICSSCDICINEYGDQIE